MAVRNLTDTAYLNNPHEQRFTVADGDAGGAFDLTGLLVKWAMVPVNPQSGAFNPTAISVQKVSSTAGHMTRVDDVNGIIQVNIFDSDTASLAAIAYRFQLEVFDSGGMDGVVVAEGELTLLTNLVEL